MKIRRFESREQLDATLVSLLERELEIGASQAVMLAGGRTPQQIYDRVAARPAQRGAELWLLYSDERYVPADSAASNYKSSLRLLKSLGLPQERILRVRTELPLAAAALDYQQCLQALLDRGTPIRIGLLGLGTDGHTASLFTQADLERARGHLAIAVRRADGMDAVTVTPEFLAHIERVIFVVAGADKREILAAFAAGDAGLIATRAVAGSRAVEVWCDAAACDA